MILKELTKAEVKHELRLAGLADHDAALPYRGYAVTLFVNATHRTFIGHSPDGKWLLQRTPLADSSLVTGTH